MSKLLQQRTDLASAYATSNEAVATAKVNCRKASDAVQAFDEAHPEVMREVHAHAGAEKKAARAPVPEGADAEGAES